jgi:uncharacterized membrane protein YidH (DUF202 family)
MSQLAKTITFVTIVTSLALIVFPVAAQITNVSGGDCGELGIRCTGTEDTKSLLDSIQTIVNAFLVLVGIVAAIYLVLGGVRYIRSQGDDGQLEEAKNTILYAVIGIIIVGLSAAIVNFAIGVVQGNNGGAGGASGQFQQVPIYPVSGPR